MLSIDTEGRLVEWTMTGEIRKMMLVTGSSGTCMDVSNDENLIVVGTEEGYINVFKTTDDDFLYEKILDRQEGRVVSCSLTTKGDYLATGSVDCVRIWNMKTGHILHKMATGRNAAKRQTIVWCITMLDDLTIISGDSRGKLTFWNGSEGLQIESITVSKEDILTLTTTEDGKTIFCAGVEPVIRKYVQTKIKRDDREVYQWVRDVNRYIHSHDIHALVCYNNKLISGGVEGCLTVSSHQPRTVYRYNPFLLRPSALSENDLLLLRYANYLEVWRLGSADAQLLEENTFALHEPPKKLLALKSKGNQMMIAAKISPNGHWIAYTTRQVLRLFTFSTHANQKPELTQVDVSLDLPNLQLIEFAPDSKQLFATTVNGTIEVISLLELELKTSIHCSEQLKGNIVNLIVSNCGKYFAVVATSGQIGIWYNEKGSKWKHLLNLPFHKHTPTAMAFRPESKKIVVVYSDMKLIEYDFKVMRLTQNLDLVQLNVSKRFPINSIVFQPQNEILTLLQTETSIYSVKLIAEDDADDKPILKKKARSVAVEKITEKQFAVVKKIKEIEFINQLLWHNDSNLVAICMSYGQLVEQLPPALKMKKFGIS